MANNMWPSEITIRRSTRSLFISGKQITSKDKCMYPSTFLCQISAPFYVIHGGYFLYSS